MATDYFEIPGQSCVICPQALPTSFSRAFTAFTPGADLASGRIDYHAMTAKRLVVQGAVRLQARASSWADYGGRFLNVTILNVRPRPRARLRTAALLRLSCSPTAVALIPDWTSARI